MPFDGCLTKHRRYLTQWSQIRESFRMAEAPMTWVETGGRFQVAGASGEAQNRARQPGPTYCRSSPCVISTEARVFASIVRDSGADRCLRKSAEAEGLSCQGSRNQKLGHV